MAQHSKDAGLSSVMLDLTSVWPAGARIKITRSFVFGRDENNSKAKPMVDLVSDAFWHTCPPVFAAGACSLRPLPFTQGCLHTLPSPGVV
jgi:hypothetical protein